MLVIRGDVTDALVQPHRVVVGPDALELGAQHGRVVDGVQVWPLALDVAEQRLDPALVCRRVRSPEVLRDRAHDHELPRRPRGHLRPVVRHGEQDRAALVIHGRVDEPVGAALERLVEQPLGLQRVGEHDLDLGRGLLGRDDRGQPLAGHQVHDHGDGDAVTATEMGRVIDPDAVLGIGDPSGERLTL